MFCRFFYSMNGLLLKSELGQVPGLFSQYPVRREGLRPNVPVLLLIAIWTVILTSQRRRWCPNVNQRHDFRENIKVDMKTQLFTYINVNFDLVTSTLTMNGYFFSCSHFTNVNSWPPIVNEHHVRDDLRSNVMILMNFNRTWCSFTFYGEFLKQQGLILTYDKSWKSRNIAFVGEHQSWHPIVNEHHVRYKIITFGIQTGWFQIERDVGWRFMVIFCTTKLQI